MDNTTYLLCISGGFGIASICSGAYLGYKEAKREPLAYDRRIFSFGPTLINGGMGAVIGGVDWFYNSNGSFVDLLFKCTNGIILGGLLGSLEGIIGYCFAHGIAKDNKDNKNN